MKKLKIKEAAIIAYFFLSLCGLCAAESAPIITILIVANFALSASLLKKVDIDKFLKDKSE